jgi:hypothetical protein
VTVDSRLFHFAPFWHSSKFKEGNRLSKNRKKNIVHAPLSLAMPEKTPATNPL